MPITVAIIPAMIQPVLYSDPAYLVRTTDDLSNTLCVVGETSVTVAVTVAVTVSVAVMVTVGVCLVYTIGSIACAVGVPRAQRINTTVASITLAKPAARRLTLISLMAIIITLYHFYSKSIPNFYVRCSPCGLELRCPRCACRRYATRSHGQV